MHELAQALLQPGAQITLAVLASSVVLFVTGWLAPEITGLLPTGPTATDMLTPAEALRGFVSPALITPMGLYPAGGLDRLQALLGSDAIRSPRRMILLVSSVVGPVSAFVPNTRIVAARLSALGGTRTLIGSSVNLLASEVSQRMGYGAFGLFSFSAIGLGV
jgi:hypothetical protein